MIFQNDHQNAQLYFEHRTRTIFSRILGFLMALFIISAGGQGFGAWADWEKNDGRAPDGIQNYLGIRNQNVVSHTAAKIEIVEGRLRMFRRMYGDPGMWTPAQQATYAKLAAQKQEYMVKYQQLSIRYNPYDQNKTASEFTREFLLRETALQAIR